MKCRLLIVAVPFAFPTGCSYSSPPTPHAFEEPRKWVSALTESQASSMSPEAAKAVVVARARIEADAKVQGLSAPQILEFGPQPTEGGWPVYADVAGLWYGDK